MDYQLYTSSVGLVGGLASVYLGYIRQVGTLSIHHGLVGRLSY